MFSNTFTNNIYSENYIGGDSFGINLIGILRVRFENESFSNNGNTFREALELYSEGRLTMEIQDLQTLLPLNADEITQNQFQLPPIAKVYTISILNKFEGNDWIE